MILSVLKKNWPWIPGTEYATFTTVAFNTSFVTTSATIVTVCMTDWRSPRISRREIPEPKFLRYFRHTRVGRKKKNTICELYFVLYSLIFLCRIDKQMERTDIRIGQLLGSNGHRRSIARRPMYIVIRRKSSVEKMACLNSFVPKYCLSLYKKISIHDKM